MASIFKHSGIGIVSASFEVELISSDNQYIVYPCRGLISIHETGPAGNVNNATFEAVTDRTKTERMYGAPVLINNPVFRYAFADLETLRDR